MGGFSFFARALSRSTVMGGLSALVLTPAAASSAYAAISVSEPTAKVTGSGAAIHSGSFNTAAGDLLVIFINSDDAADDGSSPTFDFSDNQTPHLTYTPIIERGDV